MIRIKHKKILALFINCFVFLQAFSGISAQLPGGQVLAFNELPQDLSVSVNGGTASKVRSINVTYDNNAYISLRDTANLLKGSSKAFSLEYTDGKFHMSIGGIYEATGHENTGWTVDSTALLKGHVLRNNSLYINDLESRYYSISVRDPEDFEDLYIMATDLCMILDMDMLVPEENQIIFFPEREMTVNPDRLEMEGYFKVVNGIIVGDSTTGDIFYEYDSKEAFPIASTTKLMTYLLLMEAMDAGEISINDTVRITMETQQLSKGEDGIIPMEEGDTISMRDILHAILLPSSNESALAAAIHLSGSEDAFVARMNERAAELGLSSAVFYNSHGLPVFLDRQIPAKMQNSMTPEDLFRLVTYIMDNYPSITDITSLKKYNMSSHGNREIKNTNTLLYNDINITGLKTGTTNRAGACLVTTMKATVNGSSHNIVVVLLGAETNQDRFRISQLMTIYARHVLQGKAQGSGENIKTPGQSNENQSLPVTARGIIDRILNYYVNGMAF